MAEDQDSQSLDVYMNEMRSREDCRNYKEINAHEKELVSDIKAGVKADETINALKESGKWRELSFAERRELQLAVNKGSKSRETLLNANLRLVPAIAKKYQNQGLPLVELISIGNAGLCHAIDLYETGHGTKFSTYATNWIIQYIDRDLKNTGRSVRMPVHVETELRKVNKAYYEISKQINRAPTCAELSAELDIPVERVKELMAYDSNTRAASLDMTVQGKGDDKSTTLGEIVLNTDDGAMSVFDQSVKAETTRNVMSIINNMSDREKYVMTSSYGLDGFEPKTLDEIGRELGITRERARQIRLQAEKKFKKIIASKFNANEIDEMLG